jgi:hypothetical protein
MRMYWAIAATLLCVLTGACQPKPEAAPPVTAYSLAAKYGPITGKLAALVESGEADRIVRDGKAEKREYVLGSGRTEVKVTEHLVLGEPYDIETIRRRYYDPLADIPDQKVRLLVYGQNLKENTLRITAPREIRAVLKAVRSESYEEVWNRAMRDCQVSDGTWRQGGGVRKSAWAHGCHLGLYLDVGGSEPVCLSGHASSAHFRRFETKEEGGFHNPAIFEALKRIAAKRGWELNY